MRKALCGHPVRTQKFGLLQHRLRRLLLRAGAVGEDDRPGSDQFRREDIDGRLSDRNVEDGGRR
jgi:hypothetical protein